MSTPYHHHVQCPDELWVDEIYHRTNRVSASLLQQYLHYLQPFCPMMRKTDQNMNRKDTTRQKKKLCDKIMRVTN